MGFWNNFEKETKDLELENKRLKEKIVAEAKERNRKLEEEWANMNKYTVRVTKCYLVQVLDEDGNEVACDYAFVENKKEAENTGREMIEDIRRREADENRG